MSDVWTVLLTGPTHGIETWSAAAQEAGWQALCLPLVTTKSTGHALMEPGHDDPDWIVITSSSALEPLAAALEEHPTLASCPLLCVGETSATRAIELGLENARWSPSASQNAEALGKQLLEEAQPGERVLWPRGQRSDALARQLTAGGLEVHAPVVYESVLVELTEEPPEADAVFFASPSAVRAWDAEQRAGRPAAIAIGWTTYEALEPVADQFSMVLPLIQPTSQSFTHCLQSFFPTS